MEDNSIVQDWLRSLNLVQYTQAFLDNGYDDLEICKQIGTADLDAIGVLHTDHRNDILDAVRVLLEEGGTSVYFTLEDPIIQLNVKEFTQNQENGDPKTGKGPGTEDGARPNSHVSGGISDAYVEGKRALVTFPQLQLSAIIRDKLTRDQIDITDKKLVSLTFDKLLISYN